MTDHPPGTRIDIVSDAICPWCYIGKRQLERALARLGAEGLSFSVRWNPFQLNPDMPRRVSPAPPIAPPNSVPPSAPPPSMPGSAKPPPASAWPSPSTARRAPPTPSPPIA